MIQNRFKKPIILFITLVLIFTVGYFVVQYIQARRSIQVNFTHVKNVSLFEFRTLKPKGEIQKSGDTVSLRKDTRYEIKYTGIDGYASGEVIIDNNNDTVMINPYYSQEKLDTLLTSSVITSVQNKLINTYTDTLGEYTIEKGKLYHYGEWYSTSFIYKGEYSETSDTLHVIVKKTPQGWEVVADPNITFDKFTYPNIPLDVLQDINSRS